MLSKHRHWLAASQRAGLAIVIAACGSSAPPQTGQPADTAAVAPAPEPQDTYFEGSRRVWEDARARGIVFQGVGQEPGWVVEIDSSTIRLVTNYGAGHVVIPAPEPAVDAVAGTTTYHAVIDENDLRITIREQACSDTMSGERFSFSVDVVLNATTLRGCGRMMDRLPPQ